MSQKKHTNVQATSEQKTQAWLFFIVWGLVVIGAFFLNWILGLIAIFAPLLFIFSANMS